MVSQVRQRRTWNTYNNGQPYRPARGRDAPREAVEYNGGTVHPVVRGCPSAAEFVQLIVREMKIRFYGQRTIKKYRNALISFLRWFGASPHRVTLEDVRQYLELLVDGGAGSATLSIQLAAIRTAFDKMCGRQVTLGLVTPRRPKRLPVVPSPQEVVLALQATTSLRDKLMIGLLYALGARVSEVARLRWRDFDFDRCIVSIWQGKGRVDRQVKLPASYDALLRALAGKAKPEDFVFPGERKGRHISPRTIQRVVKRAVRLARIGKDLTPHSFRHGYATHLVESGIDIRFIQESLGHVRLETTQIYTKVAVLKDEIAVSPLDRLPGMGNSASLGDNNAQPSVGRLRIDLTPSSESGTQHTSASAKVTILNAAKVVVLDGIVVRENRPGWLEFSLPPEESWRDSLCELPRAQRERIESAAFYELLQREIGKRFFALRPG